MAVHALAGLRPATRTLALICGCALLAFAATGSPSAHAASTSPAVPRPTYGVGLGPTWDPYGPWRLAHDDEFNGTSLDTTKWSYGWYAPPNQYSGPVGAHEDDCYADWRSTVANGMLSEYLVPVANVCGGVRRDYTTGLITSMAQGGSYFGELYTMTYGAAEARVWLDSINGRVTNWPAWWLKAPRDNGGTLPPYTELDVVEGLGGNTVWHVHGPNGVTDCTAASKRPLTGWHTFGVDWEPGVATFYYDGRQVGPACITPDLSAPNAQNEELVLGYGTGYPGGISNPIKPYSTMSVDWVRTYTHG